MLKVDFNRGTLKELQASGDVAEIGADLLFVIHTIYEKLDSRVKNEFKANMVALVPVCFEDFKNISEVADVLEKNGCPDVDELIDQLDELKDLLKDLKKGKDETICNKA